MVKTQTKVSKRLYLKHLSRFITIILIVIVSVGFMSGIGEVKNKLIKSNNYYYTEYNLHDINIKNKNGVFNVDDINKLTELYGDNNIEKAICYDTINENNELTRIYYYNLESNINKLQLQEGSFPTNENEVLVERKTTYIKSYNVGDKLYHNGKEYTVSGIVFNALYTYVVEEPSYIDLNKHLSYIIYFDLDYIPNPTDIYITFESRDIFNGFNNKYDDLLEKEINKINSILNPNDIHILTLKENTGLAGANFYGDKIEVISIIFVIFFLLVTLLVVYSTMVRLLDEERGQIACQKTLGYKDITIIKKYVIFVFIATIIGAILAIGVGDLLTRLIYSGMNAHYLTAPYTMRTNNYYYLGVCGIVTIATTVLTLITGMKNVNKKPVVLLTQKVAKVGHKTITEHIPFIWNRLSFKHKSTLRNVFLFKSRFFMTVISIIGSSVLVLAGMGLLDNTKVDVIGSTSAITLIAIAVIVFSALLSLLVIYNITNINISERNKEIATLMVLGYNKNEVCGYIYREIYTMSFIGAILGIPFGILFLDFAFDMIDFGKVSNINWYTWILAPIITMSFTFLSTLVLRNKILKIDMNESLKTNE